MQNVEIKNDSDALTLALVLAAKATDISKISECLEMASNIANKLSKKEVEHCKKSAEVVLEYMD